MPAALARGHSLIIGLTAFLTLIDLFAAQSILPMLAHHYQVAPGMIGVAANASTLGMAVASLAVGVLGGNLDRRSSVRLSLLLLAIPTVLLAYAPDLRVFAALRMLQGLCMATAFSLTMAHLGESFSQAATTSAFAAYVTGNVASNLFGRLMSAMIADHFGLKVNFFVLAGLNLLGAMLVHRSMGRMARPRDAAMLGNIAALRAHLGNPALRASLLIGFCILFAFIGTFTYVNFVLVRPPLALPMMQVGIAYLVFFPAMLTTPQAGRLSQAVGIRPAMWLGLALAACGIPLMLSGVLPCVLLGMVFMAVGSFLAQAIATGFVGKTARFARSTASGLYLAAYFAGGLTGSFVLGQIFDRLGWAATLAGVGVALTLAALAALALRDAPRAA